MKAIDISRFSSPDAPTINYFSSLPDIGLVIVGLWHGNAINPWADLALTNARAAGKLTAVYLGLVPNKNLFDQVYTPLRSLHAETQENLLFVAVDVEVYDVSVELIRQAIHQVQDLGQHPIIYTSRSFWERIPDHLDQELSSLPLWDASWGGVADLIPAFVPYGGWTSRVGHQYLANVRLNNVLVDFNEFDDAWINEVREVQREARQKYNLDLPSLLTDLLIAWDNYSTIKPLADAFTAMNNPIAAHLIMGGKFLLLALQRVEKALQLTPNEGG